MPPEVPDAAGTASAFTEAVPDRRTGGAYAWPPVGNSWLPIEEATDPQECGELAVGLARVAAAGLPVAPAFVVLASAASAVAEGADADVRQAIADAWGSLECPAEVRVRASHRSGPTGTDEETGRDDPAPVRRPADLLNLLAELQAASRRATAFLVQGDSSLNTRGAAYSENPRGEPIDAALVESWQNGGGGSSEGRSLLLSRGGQPLHDAADAKRGAAEAAEVVRMAVEAERVFAEPSRIEWLRDEGGVRIAGAGPISDGLPWGVGAVNPQADDRWSRANAGEVMPGVITPMSWALVGDSLDHAFAALYGREDWTRGRRFVGTFKGYVYFNFGLMAALNIGKLGMPARAFFEPIGGPDAAAEMPYGDRGMSYRSMLRNLPYVLRMTRRQQRLPKRWEGEQRWVEAHAAELAALDPSAMSERELVRAVVRSGEKLAEFVDFFMEVQGAAFAQFGILMFLLQQWTGDGRRAPALVQGLPGVRTAEGNLQLWRLAQRAANHEPARALIDATEPAALYEAIAAAPDLGWLHDEIDAFLREFGHRCAGELEVMEPRWADEPALILASFREYVRNPGQTSVEALVDRQVAAREAAQREIDATLTRRRWERLLPVRRTVVRYYARWAQRFAPLRENPKFHLLRITHHNRRLLLHVADRLVGRGVLPQRDAIFFLDASELLRLVTSLDNEAVRGRMASRARRRRLQYERWSAHPAELLRDPSGRPLRLRPAAPDDPDTRTLAGIAASPGTAEGVARVATNIAEGRELRAGEILVARFTDPGWTPIFPLASGLVTEIGGMLSHGAIVSREFGLPAVVNVRDVASKVRTGDRIRVDGDTGEVEILQASSE